MLPSRLFPTCGEVHGNRFILGPGEAAKCYVMQRFECKLQRAVYPGKMWSRFDALKM